MKKFNSLEAVTLTTLLDWRTARDWFEKEFSTWRKKTFVFAILFTLHYCWMVPMAWFKKTFSSAAPAGETTSAFRETYPHTQRPEITRSDICLVAGFLLFVAALVFTLRSIACLHGGDVSCSFASAWLGEVVMNLIR